MNRQFHRFAHRASRVFGSPYAFMAALLVIALWVVAGPVFAFSDTWQLVINTGTTVVTFLMVFLIQSSQNRDAIGLHLKLDELIRATDSARNSMIDLDKLSDRQLEELVREYQRICSQGESLEGDAVH